MGGELIAIFQLGIWLIVAIMIALVAIYIRLMKPQNKNNYNSYSDKNNENYNASQYNEDDGLNTQHEDDGPITRL